MGSPEPKEKNMMFLIADISGYTKFIVANEKAMVHSQIIVKDILNSIIEEIKLPFKVSKLEGDAVFFYADKDLLENNWDEVKGDLIARLITFFRTFAHKIAELTIHKICNCDACSHVDELKLKIIVHSGQAVMFRIQNMLELSGKDAIIVHRLLKNSVEADEYILMTESALLDIGLSQDDVEKGQEDYREIGIIDTYVYYPPEPELPAPDSEQYKFPNVFVETLRTEVSNEYATVAQTPDAGFHFHIGRRLAELLEYDEASLAEFPEVVIESFAGTGNPFSLGELKPGDRIVDVGCGAGLDGLIAAKMITPDGEVIGIDMTDEMIEKANNNAELVGQKNVEFLQGFSEALPVSDEWADVVMSNGVVNLSVNKAEVFSEMYRVLKPGGRLQIADILVDKAVPDSAKNNIALWAG